MTNKKLSYRVVDWLTDNGSQLLLAIIVLSIAVLKLFNFTISNCWQIFIVVILLIAYIIVFIINQNKQKSKTELESQLLHERQKASQLNESVDRWRKGFDEFFKHSLIFLYNSLGYGVNERISIYEHNSENNTFVMVGRYSSNPIYNKAGRGTYPNDEGYIALGWQGSAFCHGELPDPENDFESYVAAVQDDCKISKKTIQNLSMKSRSYCIHNITKAVTQEKIGVIVLESTESEKFSGEEAEQVSHKINELFYAYIICKNEC